MLKDKKRGQRRSNTEKYIKKQLKIASKHFFYNKENIPEKGRYKKQAHMDCGRPKCGICGNPRKNNTKSKSKTIQELKSEESYKFIMQNLKSS